MDASLDQCLADEALKGMPSLVNDGGIPIIALGQCGPIENNDVAARQARNALAQTAPQERAMFDHGLTAVKAKRPASWTNESCAKCHKKAYDEWKGSMHALAATNENFLRQIQPVESGRQAWCVNCHAPRNPMTDSHAVHIMDDDVLQQFFEDVPSWVSDGVDCITCHVRDHTVLATNVTEKGQQAHPMRLAPELGTAEFCGGCHQFQFKSSELPHAFFGMFQQASLEELCDYNKSFRDTARCQDCHMPDGGHEMPGGYSDEMLNRAVDMELAVSEIAKSEFEIAVQLEGNAGHPIPGGEFFRYFTLRTWLEDADGRLIKETQDIELDVAGTEAKVIRKWPQSELIKRVIVDHLARENRRTADEVDRRLKPGEKRTYRYQLKLLENQDADSIKVRSSLHYHVLNEDEAAQFDVPIEETHRSVHERSARLRPPSSEN